MTTEHTGFFLILRTEQVDIPNLLIPAVYLLFNLVYSISTISAATFYFGIATAFLAALLFSILIIIERKEVRRT